MTSISRLALIAYVLGGWLLPAAHYHAHIGPQACPVAGDVDCHGCCGHHHGEPTSTDDHDHSDSTDVGFVTGSTPPHYCGGLCALCSARTLASTTWRQFACTMSSPRADEQFLVRDAQLVPSLPTEEHLSRGPPEMA